jgi:predicted HTH domain antitoxin
VSEGPSPERIAVIWSPEARTDLRAIERELAVQILHCVDRYLINRTGDVKKLKPPRTGFRLLLASLIYNENVMKLEIEVNVADDAADKVELQEHLRKEAILALFADRKITAGKAAHELGLERLAFMDLLKQRSIPYIVYTAEDWEADANAIGEFERRRKIG